MTIASVPVPTATMTAMSSVMRTCVVLVGAAAIGLVLNRLLMEHLTTLQTLAQTDPLGARAHLATEVRAGGIALFGLTAVLGVSVIARSLRGVRLAQFPPPGIWAWGGARRPARGETARRLACVGVALGALLVVCSLAGGAVSWLMAERLLTCRAGAAGSRASAPPGTTVRAD